MVHTKRWVESTPNMGRGDLELVMRCDSVVHFFRSLLGILLLCAPSLLICQGAKGPSKGEHNIIKL
jgi:hypothetical protein